jgi:hypothetical protein
LRAAGFSGRYDPIWHIHTSSLYIKLQMRGQGFGLRALRLLRRHVARPRLMSTAKTFPEEPGSVGKPTPAQIKRLARYYRSDGRLGYQPLGPEGGGWLIANWSL